MGGYGIYSVCIVFSTPSGVLVGISNATTFYPYLKFLNIETTDIMLYVTQSVPSIFFFCIREKQVVTHNPCKRHYCSTSSRLQII